MLTASPVYRMVPLTVEGPVEEVLVAVRHRGGGASMRGCKAAGGEEYPSQGARQQGVRNTHHRVRGSKRG